VPSPPSINIHPSVLIGLNIVDGGHRAIKYTRYASCGPCIVPLVFDDGCRLHGVTENVYGEGTHLMVRDFRAPRIPIKVNLIPL
jgi:hypothetical protein